MSPHSVIIDTDPGIGRPGSVIDDGLAIALALASPELEVLGLTIVNGNVGVTEGEQSAEELLRRLGRRNIPILAGASVPIAQSMARVHETFGMPPRREGQAAVNRDDGAAAAEWLAAQVAARPGEITVLAIGPLTNVARAIEISSTFARDVKEIVTMAGNATGETNGLDVVADFNVFVDPDAADIVLRSGAIVKLIGIDQTSRVTLDTFDLADLRTRSESAVVSWLAECIASWMDIESEDGQRATRVCHLHDPLVIATAIQHRICTFAAADVTTDVNDGALSIRLTPDVSGANVFAAVNTDVEAFRSLFIERIGAL